MPRHFRIRILPSKRPCDTALVGISALLPGVDLGDNGVAIRQAPIQTLAIQRSDFNFGHVEPTGVFRGVMENDTTQKFFCRLDTKHVLKALAEVRIEVVHHQMEAARGGIDVFEQVLDESDEVRLGTAVGDQDRSLSTFGLYRDEQIASADAYVLVILSHGHSRADRQWHTGILEQLLALFVKANDGLFPLERSGVEIEQIVHSLPILFGHFANAPHQLAPRLEAVFLATDGRFRG